MSKEAPRSALQKRLDEEQPDQKTQLVYSILFSRAIADTFGPHTRQAATIMVLTMGGLAAILAHSFPTREERCAVVKDALEIFIKKLGLPLTVVGPQ